MDSSPLPPRIEPSGNLVAIFPIVKFLAFPRTIVPLHIFENRYQQMLQDINENTDEKLLVLTNLDHINQSPLDIGVLSRVISQEMLPEERSNILIECKQRVKIVDYFRPYSDNEYAIGEVNPFPEENIKIGNQIWENLFPELLSTFKKHFESSTGKKFIDYSNKRLNQLTPEEIINAMCQFSNISIENKIELLKINSLILRASSLKERLDKIF
ncbi:MAG: LON peptidase substrate-binding domain-containing protein [Candidatus Hodarchaeales archaeon]|jgi:Lon protease-like protein